MANRSTSPRFRNLVFVASVLLLPAACQFDGRPTDPPQAEDIPILWQASGVYSHLTQRVRVVARDPAVLAQLPLTEVPVDFETQMVLVAGLGPTATNELGLRIERVWREGSTIRTQERRIHPGPELKAGVYPASPWTVIIIPRSDLNVAGYTDSVPRGAVGGTAGVERSPLPARKRSGR
ncbi:MAG TPA: hypothetical protein P5159_13135 [Phycisphaerae bacterium]|nr:hypothetical protein [Phycisphaerae bacterium]